MGELPLNLDVLGVGLWADGLGTWDEARARWQGRADDLTQASPTLRRPHTTLLPPAERRRAPTTVVLALAAAEQACRDAGIAPQDMRSVFTSAHGDLEITDYLCTTLAESPEHLSPTKFHHSVHNAASGYWTIGVGNMQASTAISAGQYSFAQGFLEAATQVACEQVPVLLVAYDMPAPSPLVPITGSTALVGLALVLAPPSATASSRLPWPRLTLGLQEVTEEVTGGHTEGMACHPDTAALRSRSPMAQGLPLIEALARCENKGDHPFEGRFMLSPAQSLTVSFLGQKHDGRR